MHRADGSQVPVALEANLFRITVKGELAEPPEPALRDADLSQLP